MINLLIVFVLFVLFLVYDGAIRRAVRRANYARKYSNSWCIQRVKIISSLPPSYRGRNAEKQLERDLWARDVVDNLRAKGQL